MSKLETVKALNDSAPQLQIVKSVRKLQQAVNLVHEDLKLLPDLEQTLLASLLPALEPLSELSTQILAIPTALEQMMVSLAALMAEVTKLSERTTASLGLVLETKMADMLQSLSVLEQSQRQSRSEMEQTIRAEIEKVATTGEVDKLLKEVKVQTTTFQSKLERAANFQKDNQVWSTHAIIERCRPLTVRLWASLRNLLSLTPQDQYPWEAMLTKATEAEWLKIQEIMKR